VEVEDGEDPWPLRREEEEELVSRLATGAQ
jgi:hypothetical protein